MIVKKKLRDLTSEEYIKLRNKHCYSIETCGTCLFHRVMCVESRSCWVENKDLYSDKFLDQEIEVEVKNNVEDDILNKVEKECLSSIIKPFRERILCIKKVRGIIYENIEIDLKYSEEVKCKDSISLPYFNPDTMYKGMKIEKEYTLEELGL